MEGMGIFMMHFIVIGEDYNGRKAYCNNIWFDDLQFDFNGGNFYTASFSISDEYGEFKTFNTVASLTIYEVVPAHQWEDYLEGNYIPGYSQIEI